MMTAFVQTQTLAFEDHWGDPIKFEYEPFNAMDDAVVFVQTGEDEEIAVGLEDLDELIEYLIAVRDDYLYD